MLYPLYDYYQLSKLTLEEIVDDYLKNFYYKRYSQSKSENVEKRVQNSKKIAAIDAVSIRKHVVPNSIDFGSAINETFWFMFQSNSTQALAVLIAAREWNKRVNRKYHICSEKEIRDKALYIFKKYSIYEEMTQKRFEEMTRKIDSADEKNNCPKPLNVSFSESDKSKLMEKEYQDKVILIMADGGTKEQIQIKLELLLNKRKKTQEMLLVEKSFRNFFRKVFESKHDEIMSKSHGDMLMQRINASTILLSVLQEIDDAASEDENVKTMKELGNQYGISFNLIKNEEYQKALSRYDTNNQDVKKGGKEDFYKRFQASMEERFGITPDDIESTMKGLNLAPDLSKNDNIENKLLNLAKEGVDYIGKNFRELDEKGYYEALLLCTTFVIDLGTNHQNEIDIDKMEDRYFLLLFDTMIHCQLKDEIGFINKRIGFYTEEMEKLQKDSHYLISNIYNALFINPLCNNPLENGYNVSSFADIKMIDAFRIVLRLTQRMLLEKKMKIIEDDIVNLLED